MDKDYLIQKIGWYRHLFTFASAINVACIAWLVSNYDKTIIQLIVLDGIAIVFTAAGIIIAVYEIRKYLKRMRNI